MTIRFHARVSRETIAEGAPATLYLLAQVSAGDATPDRPALNVAAVVDRSGSMAGPKLAYTKQALRFLVDQTTPADTLGIITFDDQVQTLAASGHITNKDALKAQLATIVDGGSTNLSGGLLAGYKEVRRHLDPRQINRVLLMTDGQANVGVTDPSALIKKADELKQKGIQLSTLGVGADFEEDLLAAMAEAGGGNFHFIANPDQIPEIFAAELQSLLSTVAQGLELRFRPAPGVTVTSVIGYPPSGAPDGVTLNLPDLTAGETKSLVLALDVEPAFAGDRWLGRLELAGAAVPDGTDLSLELDATVTVADSTAPERPDVMDQVHLARTAEAVEQAIAATDRHDPAAGAAILREAAAPLQASADPALAARARELQEQADALSEHPTDPTTRKQMRAQAFRHRR